MAAAGIAHYHKELKPFINTGADIIAEWLTSYPAAIGDVLHVSDGDTITVAGDAGDIKVRLYGIDAPEMSQKYGNEAKSALENMVSGKNITLTIIDIDRYGRSVAVIEHDGVNINEQMLALGHAWYYEAYCKKRFCNRWKETAAQAKKEKAGLWKDSKAVAPWEHRVK